MRLESNLILKMFLVVVVCILSESITARASESLQCFYHDHWHDADVKLLLYCSGLRHWHWQ